MSPRRQYNDGMEVIFEDLDVDSTVLERELYDRIFYQLLQGVDEGFFRDSFKVSFVGATTVSIANGLGIQLDNTQVDPEPIHRMIYKASAANQAIASPDTVHDRIDLICVKWNRVVTATDMRNFKDAITSLLTEASFDVETDWSSDLLVVAGTPSVSPTQPATPSGYKTLAAVVVHAVTGLADQSDITDLRALLPVAGQSLINTTGYNRAPISTATPLDQVLAAFDAYLKNGYQNYTDFDDLGADPAAPVAGKQRVYLKGGVAFIQDSTSAKTPLGSGGGGGGGANWVADGGSAPLEDIDNGEKIWIFLPTGSGQKLSLFIKVPQTYISGRPISLYLGHYSPSTTGNQLLGTTTSLIRKNLDAVGSVANQHVSVNTAIANTATANMYHQAVLDLTDSVGKINGFNVTFGDLIRVDLSRKTDTDTNNISFIPSSTEVKFS